ncbi:MAG: twin-arginine translocation signal domain-containing protein [Acidobacteria bacterium]|nr:twin-arginine translocation signal domain-containing protein [Acidobacteriota bacterium]
MQRLPTNRRSFLKSALAAGAYLAAPGGPAARAAFAAQESARRFPQLRVARPRRRGRVALVGRGADGRRAGAQP